MATLPSQFDPIKFGFAPPKHPVDEEILVVFLGEVAGADQDADAKTKAASKAGSKAVSKAGGKSKSDMDAATARYLDQARDNLAAGFGSDKDVLEHVLHALKNSRFRGKFADSLKIFAPPAASSGAKRSFSRIMLLGYGKTPAPKGKTSDKTDKNAPYVADHEQNSLTHAKLAELGAAITSNLANVTQKSARVLLAGLAPALTAAKIKEEDAALELALGAKLRAWRFDTYLTKVKPEDQPSLNEITFILADAKAAKAAEGQFTADHSHLADAVGVARYLVAEPANALNPPLYAAHLQAIKIPGLKIEIFDEKKLASLKMGALLGVGQGSEFPPRMVVLTWQGGKDKNAPPLALLGKGVTFDSGGLSLKPAKSMEDMKWDMAGSATVVGTMIALARRRAKANVIGVIGLVENMPSHLAQRPGDIVTSHSGQTIEVLNTDAEGRLVLADLLSYTEQTYQPATMIDLATLTGAIITALGHEHVGLFANDDHLAKIITDCGQATHEAVWRLPLGSQYDKLIKSDIADMKNIGDGTAGSIVGAQFLQRFVAKTKWAHLDIAGVAWANKTSGVTPKGASGWGVRLLDQLVRRHYETA